MGFLLPFVGYVIGKYYGLKGWMLNLFCISFSFIMAIIGWGLKEIIDIYKPLPTGFDFLDWNVSLVGAMIGCVVWSCMFVLVNNFVESFKYDETKVI